jgi:hypothetical protein
MNQLNKSTFRIITAIGILLILGACSGRPKGILNKSDMTEILTEMHKLEGSLDAAGLLSDQTVEKDNYYKSILEKYKITQAEFDSSVVWYTKNPKKFAKIYDEVFIRITQLDKSVKKGKYYPVDTTEHLKVKINLWTKAEKYVFTKDSVRTKLNFEIKDSTLIFGDVYTLRFLQQIAPEDSCQDQHIIFRINYSKGKADSIYQKTYNDGLLRRYTFHVKSRQKNTIESITGELLGSSAYKGTFNAKLDSISLTREYRTDLQENLRKMIEEANDTTIRYTVIQFPYSLAEPLYIPQKSWFKTIKTEANDTLFKSTYFWFSKSNSSEEGN